ncbi:hypothetical protein DRQ26_01150 [bacterium]|nr:MAG: hypothetical protein DRQ26_01150 [bacterium]
MKQLIPIIELLVVVLVGIEAYIGFVGWTDFGVYYTASRLVSSGTPDKMYDFDILKRMQIEIGEKGWPYIYPPFFAIVMQPFLMFDEKTSFWIYFILQLPILWLFLFMLRKNFWDGENSKIWILVLLTLAISTTTVRTLSYGQVNFIVWTMWLLSFWLYSKQKPVLGSLALALSTMIKVIPLLSIIVLLHQRKWKEILYLFGWIVAIFGLTLFFVDIDTWIAYIHAAASIGETVNSIALYGETGIRRFLHYFLPSMEKFWFILSFVFVVITYLKIRSLKDGWSYLGYLIPISSPIVWAHHFLNASVPFLFFGQKLWGRKTFYWFAAFNFLALVRSPFVWHRHILKFIFLLFAFSIVILEKRCRDVSH